MVSMVRMSSSRATIIAGAMPPRVIATTARQAPSSPGPCLSSRQASARLSRWIWSQETWKPFSCGRRSADTAQASCLRPETTSMSGASSAFMPTTW